MFLEEQYNINGHINKENEDVLEAFCIETGYKTKMQAFQNDVTYFKTHFEAKRKKKKSSI